MNAHERGGERGFTIVEVIIAIVVLTVGLLGLVTTAALVTRMIGQGQRSAVAATFASQRMERLRLTACDGALRADGTETLTRGGVAVATNNWTFTDVSVPGVTLAWKVVLSVKYTTVRDRTRTEYMETIILC